VSALRGDEMRSIKTLLLAIALIAALLTTLFIFSLNVIDPEILSAITVISALLAAFLFSFLILIYTQLPGVPEKRPVFKIEDETVKEDLIRRGLMEEYPNGTRYVNLGGIEELIKKGVYAYRINANGTIELVSVPSE